MGCQHGGDARLTFGAEPGDTASAILRCRLAVLRHQEYIDECLHIIRTHYPNVTEAEILWRDWDWVNAARKRIDDDKREARLWALNSSVAAMALIHKGDAEPYNQMLEACLTDEQREALDEQRKEELKKTGKLLRPRRAGEATGIKRAAKQP